MDAIIIALAILGTSLVVAQDDPCSKYGLDTHLPGASCADIYNKNPTSRGNSGYYVLKTDHLFFAYCDMELDCGGNKGGWMRLADINTKRGDTCPSGWGNYISYCTGGSAAGCYSAQFPINSTSYTKVCGGKQWDTRREIWMAFIHQRTHMEKSICTHQQQHHGH